jgi:hypothetical protein
MSDPISDEARLAMAREVYPDCTDEILNTLLWQWNHEGSLPVLDAAVRYKTERDAAEKRANDWQRASDEADHHIDRLRDRALAAERERNDVFARLREAVAGQSVVLSPLRWIVPEAFPKEPPADAGERGGE